MYDNTANEETAQELVKLEDNIDTDRELTDEDIIAQYEPVAPEQPEEDSQESEEADGDDQEILPITKQQAIAAVNILKQFAEENPDVIDVEPMVVLDEMQKNIRKKFQPKQTQITQFFTDS